MLCVGSLHTASSNFFFYYPEDGGKNQLRNVGNKLLTNVTSYFRRLIVINNSAIASNHTKNSFIDGINYSDYITSMGDERSTNMGH
jgi:hypothetical protein